MLAEAKGAERIAEDPRSRDSMTLPPGYRHKLTATALTRREHRHADRPRYFCNHRARCFCTLARAARGIRSSCRRWKCVQRLLWKGAFRARPIAALQRLSAPGLHRCRVLPVPVPPGEKACLIQRAQSSATSECCLHRLATPGYSEYATLTSGPASFTRCTNRFDYSQLSAC